jgi:putative transposase
LERAYAHFFARRADFPRFKKKGQSDSFRYPQGVKLDQANSRIFLPKLDWLHYRNSRDVLGTVKNVTVSQSCGKWYVSIRTGREVEPPLPKGCAVGLDMGIARFATLSDSTFFPPLNSFKQHQTRLRKAQQAMSRKQKFSSASMPASAMPAATTCTRPRQLSAKTTRWCVSRICRFAICPGQRQAALNNRVKTFGPSLA